MDRLGTLPFLLDFGAEVFFEEQLIYFPQRHMELTPADLGLPFEDVFLRAEDGPLVHGWYFPLTTSRFSILICHGNSGNISHRLERVVFMRASLRADVLLFDYRGYGRSGGRPNEPGTYRDGRAALTFLLAQKRVPWERVILFGESLGAAVAVQLAVEFPARALVLESAFTSIPDMARATYPWLPVGRFLRTRYDNLAKIDRVGKPVLFFHGSRDRVVPIEQGRRLFDAAGEPKAFFTITGAGHNDTVLVGGEAYRAAWQDFLDEL